MKEPGVLIYIISATALHGASLVIAQDYFYYYSSQKRWHVTSPAALRKREK